MLKLIEVHAVFSNSLTIDKEKKQRKSLGGLDIIMILIILKFGYLTETARSYKGTNDMYVRSQPSRLNIILSLKYGNMQSKRSTTTS